MKIEKYRDIQLMFPNPNQLILIAGESSAAIGTKDHDYLKVRAEITGQMATRVVLLEILSLGGQPQLMMNLLGNEMKPTGQQLLAGIQQELEVAGFPDLAINGSTEENMPTSMTSLGLMLVASAQTSQLRIKQVKAGHSAYQVGQPYVGQEVLDNWDILPSYADLAWLKQFNDDQISEIVPIGSKGSLNEGQQVAQVNQLSFRPEPAASITYGQKSAGPATSFLVVGTETIYSSLRNHFDFVEKIGVYHA